MRIKNKIFVGTLGEWTFYRYSTLNEKDPWYRRELYTFEGPINDSDQKTVNEWFGSLDEAMVAAVVYKTTGPRGAGGSGVGTLTDWVFAALRGWKK